MRLVSYSEDKVKDKEILLMVVDATDEELAEGVHESITLFDHRLTNALVENNSHTKSVWIESLDDRVCVFKVNDLPSYFRMFGQNAPYPDANVVIAAHILKGRMPELHSDIENFYAWLLPAMSAVEGRKPEDFELVNGQLVDQVTGDIYDVIEMYRLYLMLGNTLRLDATEDGRILVRSPRDPEVSMFDWLVEQNKRMETYAASADLLAAYISFDDKNVSFTMTFVGRDGATLKHVVDPSEFMYLVQHNYHPAIVVTGEGAEQVIHFDYRVLMPDAYHEFVDNTFDQSRATVKLLGFI